MNGRDFAGIVVKASKSPSRIKAGDVVRAQFDQSWVIRLWLTVFKVFGPSTDYRDVRKAAYQEYLVTTDFNVARVPDNLPVNTSAALGVAFVSALLALGISLGFNFADVTKGPQGPDFLSLLKDISQDDIPQDVQDECCDGIREAERPRSGEWFAIWGGKYIREQNPTLANYLASSNTGLAALQLAKLAGLRVICVADAVRHGARLVDLGADVIVDRQDPARAVEIILSVTKGGLRFALDTVGKDTAGRLVDSLQRSKEDQRSHLVGLTGLPEVRLAGIRYHSVPIKVFHSVPVLGQRAMEWLEELIVKATLKPPEVSLADGGLEGINGALAKLKSGSISGKRIVVPILSDRNSEPNGVDVTNGVKEPASKTGTMEYADKLNTDSSRIKFA